MDNLARDAITATRMGMSYGYWKAEHPNTKRDITDKSKPKSEPRLYRNCAICGKRFAVGNNFKMVCSVACRTERQRQQSNAYTRKWRKEQKKNKEAMNEG